MYRKFLKVVRKLYTRVWRSRRTVVPFASSCQLVKWLIQDIQLVYRHERLRSVIHYVPSDHKLMPVHAFAGDIDVNMLCRSFRPSDVKIVLTLVAMEEHLDFHQKNQVLKYVDCVRRIRPLLGTDSLPALSNRPIINPIGNVPHEAHQ